MDILKIKKSLCKLCYACIRVCPVKAIKITTKEIEIIKQQCILCGQCLTVCVPKAIFIRNDVAEVKKLLDSPKKVVGIIAPEFLAAFPDSDFRQIETGLKKLGFFALEDTLLAEEIVAEEYLRLLLEEHNKPFIRSSCPAVVNWTEHYHPELIPYLAPIVTPMIVQGYLIKTLYPEGVATVYIGPCVAKKALRKKGAIDAVLTFEELKTFFEEISFEISSADENQEETLLARSLSVSEGFPRSLLAANSLVDTKITVLRGISQAKKELDYFAEESTQFFDILSCHGCVDGPSVDKNVHLSLRKKLIQNFYKQPGRKISFDSLRPNLPRLNLKQEFQNLKIELPQPTEEELTEILIEGGRINEAELNCGSCGYDKCRANAVAIFQKMSDWSTCLPFQRELFAKTTSELKQSSYTDALTGFHNHRGFVEGLKIEFNRVLRYHSPLSLLMIDVDNFKKINDSYGHLEGDRLLKLVSQMLRQNLREIDIPARYGGDEFAIILPETKKTEAFAVAEKLRRIVEGAVFLLEDEQREKVTLSIGVCSVNPDDDDPLNLLRRADKAMYRAKEKGRNQTFISS